MRILKNSKAAAMKEIHTKREMDEIESAFVNSEKLPYTIQELIEMSRNENLHKDRR